jgi:hypothetical protein
MLPQNKNENVAKLKTLSDESLLYSYWQYFCHNKKFLTPQKLKGIDPGQLNKNEGPDFQGAEFELKGKIYRGDVEIHIKNSDWFSHGHHQDNRYDRVVLHLVWQESPKPVINSKDQLIPSISMKSMRLPEFIKKKPSFCILNNRQNLTYESQIKNLALQRMIVKGKEINRLVAGSGIDQTLFLMLLKSLGNIQNRENYERISYLIPWKLIHDLKDKNNPPLEYWLALFWGVAGFLDERNDERLKIFWMKIYPEIKGKVLNKNQWKRGGLRPTNNPRIRLAGLAHYIYQMKESSIYININNLFYDRLEHSLLVKFLMANFTPKVPPALIKIKRPVCSPWGRDLIIEIIGNVFVPFLYNLALEKGSYGFAAYLQQFYFSLPATINYGRLKPFKKWTAANSTAKRFFYLNQALLQLQNNYCYIYKCESCPLQTFQQKN